MTLPNKITVFRLLLIPAFVAALLAYSPERLHFRFIALGIYVLAAVSDGVDGYIARHYNLQSQLGKMLDPLADKLLVNIAFIFLAVNPYLAVHVPLWVPPVILLRDFIIVGGAMLIKRRYGNVHVEPSLLGKFGTVVQFVAVIAVLLELAFAMPLVYIMLLISLAAMGQYVLQGWNNVRVRNRRSEELRHG